MNEDYGIVNELAKKICDVTGAARNGAAVNGGSGIQFTNVFAVVSDPIPSYFTLAHNSEGPVISSDSHRVHIAQTLDPLEPQARVMRILREKAIRANCCLLHRTGQSRKMLPELPGRSGSNQ